MKHIVFDIETIPQDEAKLLALAPEFTAAANLKYRFSNALSIELVPATVASAGSEKKPASGH